MQKIIVALVVLCGLLAAYATTEHYTAHRLESELNEVVSNAKVEVQKERQEKEGVKQELAECKKELERIQHKQSEYTQKSITPEELAEYDEKYTGSFGELMAPLYKQTSNGVMYGDPTP